MFNKFIENRMRIFISIVIDDILWNSSEFLHESRGYV